MLPKNFIRIKSSGLLKVYEMTLKNSREQLKKTEEMFRIGQVANRIIPARCVRAMTDSKYSADIGSYSAISA
jgi:hypothetical protein